MKISNLFILMGCASAAVLFTACSRSGTEPEEPSAPSESSITRSTDIFSEPIRTPRQRDPEEVLATVDGEPVTVGDVQQELALLITRLRGRVPPERIAQQREELQQQALNGVINRRVLISAIESEHIEVSQDEVETRISELENNLPEGVSIDDQLKQIGADRSNLVDNIRTELRVNKLLDQHVEIAPVSEEDIETFYNRNIEQFRVPQTVEAHHLMIVNTGGTETAVQPKEKMETIRRQLAGGDTTFEDLYEETVDEPGRLQGGQIRVPRGRLQPVLDDALFDLEPGELSPVLESSMGVHVIQVVSNMPARTTSLEDARDRIEEGLRNLSRQRAIRGYIEELRSGATIEQP